MNAGDIVEIVVCYDTDCINGLEVGDIGVISEINEMYVCVVFEKELNHYSANINYSNNGSYIMFKNQLRLLK